MPSYITDANLNSYELAFCGGLAGVVSRFFIAPLDVIKIRMQLQTHRTEFGLQGSKILESNVKYTSMTQTMKKIAKEEGIRGLYKGNVPAEYLYLSYSAVEFWAYKELEMALETMDHKKQIPHVAKTFLCGMAAGSVATMATYPFDLLRTRFAMEDSRKHISLVSAIKKIYNTEGKRGFYRGVGPTLVQIMPYMGLVFSSYDALAAGFKKMREQGLIDPDYKPLQDMLSGALSSVIGKTAVYPMDVVRKRMQAQTFPSVGVSWWTCLQQIVQKEGYSSLYKGLTPSLVKVAPAVSLTFLVFEESKKGMLWLKDHE
ncbi:mitochondrial carrier domain-containing protein [Phycomyces blakesleeanus]|uniref:Mitochondrial carrier protein n=2 Tax=Phycomyces blakesleeanus TaxID=4837 RepID=A0A162Q0N8_PHYB8|nr:hypothetical protein PHYBLDRAFT_186133 [Phycomyces blakesleeanus NRRL 1555(-)]OAD76106.1 hypothetical protein PHYBLDRAFT_186133 [Phycomyces blakesleeanus NRRL 1555(-)]|eukprot:XP_018294146.1 hypothetical protein PHYBLDRAFT_186133 [Phycomyces blakesleeanus NRRL 1555(-)]